jgi:hypothetical protein
MNAAKKPQFLSSLRRADPFIAELVSLNTGQTSQIKPQQTSILTRRMHGRDGDAVSRVKGKSIQPAFFKNRKGV